MRVILLKFYLESCNLRFAAFCRLFVGSFCRLCNRKMIMSCFGKIEMSSKLIRSEGACDAKREEDFNDSKGSEEVKGD